MQASIALGPAELVDLGRDAEEDEPAFGGEALDRELVVTRIASDVDRALRRSWPSPLLAVFALLVSFALPWAAELFFRAIAAISCCS